MKAEALVWELVKHPEGDYLISGDYDITVNVKDSKFMLWFDGHMLAQSDLGAVKRVAAWHHLKNQREDSV